MCTFFCIRVHAVKVDWTEQNEQYFIGQSIVTSNEGYTSLGTVLLSNFIYSLNKKGALVLAHVE
jgi:hypothetical protein